MSAIRVLKIVKRYGANTVLNGIDLTIEPGEVVCILGPSGSGKSTLLRCMNMLERPTAGQVFIGDDELTAPGAPIDALRQRVGMVFQQFNLFPHKTALENVCLAPVKVRGMNAEEAAQRGRELLARVGLSEKADEHPSRLSGGQQQRVAIARALAMDPQAMLFDEATSALDPETVKDFLGVMRELASSGMTMAVVTHEIGFARSCADRVVFMDGGLIVEQGPPSQVIDAPREERTKRFLSQVL